MEEGTRFYLLHLGEKKMSAELDKAELRETARKIFHFMTIEHTGPLPGFGDKNQAERQNDVDADPPVWGLDINKWDWSPGVGVNSIAAYYDASRDPAALNFLVSWVKKNRHLARKFQHVNVMTPFGIFPDMARWTGDPYFLDTALEYGDWILKNSVRTSTGAFQHGGETDARPGAALPRAGTLAVPDISLSVSMAFR